MIVFNSIKKQSAEKTLLVGFFLLMILLQFINLYSLTQIYTQDDYLSAFLPDGLHDYGWYFYIAGRIIPGYLLISLNQGFADFWFSLTAHMIMIFTCFLFISVMVKQLVKGSKLPFYIILAAITIAFCHPYWFDMLRFKVNSLPITLGLLFAMSAIVARAHASNKLLIVILQLLSISCFQTIVYFFIVFELLYSLISYEKRGFKDLFEGILISVVAMVLYLLELKLFAGGFSEIINASDSVRRMHIGGIQRGSFYLSIASILEFVFYSFRTLFLDEAIFNGYSKLIILAFLFSSVLVLFKKLNHKTFELLSIFGMLFFMFSSPVHAVIQEDHYSNRILIHVSLIIGIIPVIFQQFKLDKKYLILAILVLPVTLLFNSYHVASLYKDSFNQQQKIIQEIETDFFENKAKSLSIKAVAHRGTQEWDELSKGILYTPQIYAHSSTYEMLSHGHRIPFFRDKRCEFKSEVVNKTERKFYSMEIDADGCAMVTYAATKNQTEENKFYLFLKGIKKSLEGL